MWLAEQLPIPLTQLRSDGRSAQGAFWPVVEAWGCAGAEEDGFVSVDAPGVGR